jgi:hypothetical protein
VLPCKVVFEYDLTLRHGQLIHRAVTLILLDIAVRLNLTLEKFRILTLLFDVVSPGQYFLSFFCAYFPLACDSL